MNDDLRRLIRERLSSDGSMQKNWSGVVLAACDGAEALDEFFRKGTSTAKAADAAATTKRFGAYLTSVAVQGFRGIGPKQVLEFNPGPGLTIITGRNGSGKSSFAEALEVLFTGDSNRWSERSKVWKEGWRSLHNPHPAAIEAEMLLEGQGPSKVSCLWDDGAPLEVHKTSVQHRGKAKTSLDAMGWKSALVSFRPFLSYNELGSMLDEGPSKLYDALSMVLGLEDLVNAQGVLATSRLKRQQSFDAADQQRTRFIETLRALLANESDDRASACLDALTAKSWGIADLEKVLSPTATPPADQDLSVLTRALALEAGDPEHVAAVVAALRTADEQLKALAGSDAESSRQIISLLEAAIKFHAAHGDGDCPVCGNQGALSKSWADTTRNQIERLKRIASGSEYAHRAADAALRQARELLVAPPKLLKQLFEVGVDSLDMARQQWDGWHAGSSITDLAALATHLEARHVAFATSVSDLLRAVTAELHRREDRWRPIGTALSAWLEPAEQARVDAEQIPRIKAAEAWLKDVSGDIRNQRFAPIADKAMAIWEHLRQQSNVALGRIELVGAKSQRRVTLDVTVDGIPGAALGVMSQGELHSLALSLFLPRATLPESPFRFVVIDDPVQSMDPARVDGLARALEDTATTRQVIVFTHDERLSEAVRRLNIKSSILSVTRRPKSVVEIRTALDPIRAHIEDALALVHTTELPKDVLGSLVPGFCRSALEAALIRVVRRRRLAAGREHSQVEEELLAAGKLTSLAALALFDDKDRGGDVMKRLNQFGSWAGDVFKQTRSGVHEAVAGDLKVMIEDTERLADKISELK